jgi:hypothetical protein
MTVWKVLVQLATGPHKEVVDMAKQIVNTFKLKVNNPTQGKQSNSW